METKNSIVCDDGAAPDPKAIAAAILLTDGIINTAEEAALVAGYSLEVFQAAIDDPVFETYVKAELAKRKMTGKGAILKSKVALDSLVSAVAEKMNDPETPVGTLIRAGEFLYRVSGLDAEQSAELRTNSGKPGSEVFILKNGDADPPPALPGVYRIVIDLRSKTGEKVIGGGDAE